VILEAAFTIALLGVLLYKRFSVCTSAVKMPTIANEKISFEVKFVHICLRNITIETKEATRIRYK
jgi:hypothetical protein